MLDEDIRESTASRVGQLFRIEPAHDVAPSEYVEGLIARLIAMMYRMAPPPVGTRPMCRGLEVVLGSCLRVEGDGAAIGRITRICIATGLRDEFTVGAGTQVDFVKVDGE